MAECICDRDTLINDPGMAVPGCPVHDPVIPPAREEFENISDFRLLLDTPDYNIFRRWANEMGYGDSAYTFRKLLRKAGLK